ncbi:hypothetical protein, partial [Burkholderia gladioli]|uniref:hypothetical protein n=1 Tax=Burkholderia gladioli TaxID=28095 RepID=UPI001ABA3A4F
IAGNSAGMAFGLRGICSPWDKNMPRTQNYGQAPLLGAFESLKYNEHKPYSDTTAVFRGTINVGY